VYAERAADEPVHDYMSVTVLQADEAVPCIGDIDGNSSVNGADLASLLSSWGPCAGCLADLDSNDVVDGRDLSVLLTRWGSCP
jgi:hypothetical protein